MFISPPRHVRGLDRGGPGRLRAHRGRQQQCAGGCFYSNFSIFHGEPPLSTVGKLSRWEVELIFLLKRRPHPQAQREGKIIRLSLSELTNVILDMAARCKKGKLLRAESSKRGGEYYKVGALLIKLESILGFQRLPNTHK